ncbi:hypothetical protein EVA_12998 [gut metagenome]|uniref:Uncharacterized protein n=1 Tax=gut metagenome TaxID=749906 RepID=J9CFT0_9ZZZZ
MSYRYLPLPHPSLAREAGAQRCSCGTTCRCHLDPDRKNYCCRSISPRPLFL